MNFRFRAVYILNGTFKLFQKNKRGFNVGSFHTLIKFDYPMLGEIM